ncbi:MAG: hypothetical protein KF889_05065 [Alphaproteobacteria bacterium]|nr:hypothetical protein [Alphaproteobacteria bacterium]MCW5742240.1 hypothetical protein [Alphaproteobacteria bacterium]
MEVWLIAGVVVVSAVAVFSLLNRRRGIVIDAPRQALSSSAARTAAAAQPDTTYDLSAGDMLKAEGVEEPLQHFADWLEAEASEEIGVAVEAPGPARRIADAARAVMPVILAQGRGVVDLPALVVDAAGSRDFRREVDIPQLERAVAHLSDYDVLEMTEWRRDAPRVRTLAAWLEDQVFEDMPPGDCETDDATVRIIEAARQAILDIDSMGRADIALIAIGRDSKGQTFDTRRSVDTKQLQTIINEYD